VVRITFGRIVVVLIVGVGLWKIKHPAPPQQTIVVITSNEAIASSTVVIPIASTEYRYDSAPSIDRDAYIAIMCEAGPTCSEAGSMYDILVKAHIDPVVEAAQADHETGRGTAGVGRETIKNLHGVQCFGGDGRIEDSKVPWGNGCAGVYATYADSVRTWSNVINKEYVALGLNTPLLAISKYAPVSDGNSPPDYINAMERNIDKWRAQYPLAMPKPDPSAVRIQLVTYALSLQGVPYITGGGSSSYRQGNSTEGGDCSSTMQNIYNHVTGIDIGQSTFTQRPNLQLVDESKLQPGDLWYGTYSDDEHVGMVLDANNDGKWDLLNNGGLASNMHIDYDFMANPYFNEHTMDFRTVLIN